MASLLTRGALSQISADDEPFLQILEIQAITGRRPGGMLGNHEEAHTTTPQEWPDQNWYFCAMLTTATTARHKYCCITLADSSEASSPLELDEEGHTIHRRCEGGNTVAEKTKSQVPNGFSIDQRGPFPNKRRR